jgi:hypothetical protein
MLQRHTHRPALLVEVDDQVVAHRFRAAAHPVRQGDGEGVGVGE